MLSFHSTDYIQMLKDMNDCDDIEKWESRLEEYGLGNLALHHHLAFSTSSIVTYFIFFLCAVYDCPLIEGIYDFVRAIVGSSIVAARSLISGSAHIAINWYGGWHHAQRLFL